MPKTGFPTTRMRRNRYDEWTRRLVAESQLTVNDLIWPVFVHNGHEPKIDIPSLPGVARLSISQLVKEVGRAKSFGIPLVAVFPVIDPAISELKVLVPAIVSFPVFRTPPAAATLVASVTSAEASMPFSLVLSAAVMMAPEPALVTSVRAVTLLVV